MLKVHVDTIRSCAILSQGFRASNGRTRIAFFRRQSDAARFRNHWQRSRSVSAPSMRIVHVVGAAGYKNARAVVMRFSEVFSQVAVLGKFGGPMPRALPAADFASARAKPSARHFETRNSKTP